MNNSSEKREPLSMQLAHKHKFHLNFVEFHWNSAFYDFSANVLKTIATKR